MAVLLKCGAIFLHVPKTGGSWVTNVLLEQGLVKNQFGHIHADMVRALYYARSSEIAARGLYDWAKSHVPLQLKALGPAQKIKHAAESIRQQNVPFCFCFVRNPLDWYESWWRYMGQRSGFHWEAETDMHGWHPCAALKETGNPDFHRFVRNVIETRPGFVTELYSTYAQPEIGFVGRQETLVDDLIQVLGTLNVNFDEHRIRESQRVNVSDDSCDSVGWEDDLREALQKTEYAAMLRFGYLSDSATMPLVPETT
jgi:hypothetical protein